MGAREEHRRKRRCAGGRLQGEAAGRLGLEGRGLAGWEHWEGPGHPKPQCHSARAAFRAAWPLDQELSLCQGRPLYSDPV